jgi:hypothetical protein
VLHSAFTRAAAAYAKGEETFYSALKIKSELGDRRHRFIANETTQQKSPKFLSL